MDFFHCNSCFAQPNSARGTKFCLTSCGHSFCGECVNPSIPRCKVCDLDCKLMPLSNNLPEGLKLYFCDAVKETKQLLNIYSIQWRHCKLYLEEYLPRLSFLSHIVTVQENKYVATKDELDRKKTKTIYLEKQLEMLSVQNGTLKNEIEKLTDQLNKMKMPVSHGIKKNLFNSSFMKQDFAVSNSNFPTPSPSYRSSMSLPKLSGSQGSINSLSSSIFKSPVTQGMNHSSLIKNKSPFERMAQPSFRTSSSSIRSMKTPVHHCNENSKIKKSYFPGLPSRNSSLF